MERTIDGIAYIAKSEVIHLIDGEIASSRRMLEDYISGDPYVDRWEARIIGLQCIRNLLVNPEER